MNPRIFAIKAVKILLKIAFVCLLFSAASVDLAAQYKGAPVKKNRLLQALRSRQLQTQDIVTIINTNGVDFPLTPENRKALVAAGARPEVIRAVANNPRFSSQDNLTAKSEKNSANRKNKNNAAASYDDLLAQAIYSYKDKKNPQGAVRILEAAMKMKPKNPEAYQMLGFVYLYGLKDLAQAEKSMRESFENGGSAVFRVYHDDNGKFTKRCTGSLYVSQNTLRFESDDNVHTFETTTVNIDKIRLDTETTRTWKKRSIFKIFLKIGNQEAKFRFTPLTGEQEESKLAARFVTASNSNASAAVSTLISPH